MGSGPVEADESFHGGKPKNMHRSRRLKLKLGENGYAEKTAVFGMLEPGDSAGTRSGGAERQADHRCKPLSSSNVGFGSLRSTRTIGPDTMG